MKVSGYFNIHLSVRCILSDMMSILYTSQLLADSLVAMVTVMDTGLLSVAMLQYVLHNYATYVQVGKSVFKL